METELKLLIEPFDAEALRQHPLLKKYASDPPHEQTLSGIYFDTPNYDVGNISKADRGYGLTVPHEISAIKATPIQLTSKMTIEAAFQVIVENCLSQIQANEPGVTREHDIESVHQMRVGLRRLRSALGMFKKVIACPDEIQGELKWLGTELGAARDWDVLTGSTLSRVGKEIAAKELLAPVRKATQDRATASHQKAAAAVQSSRYSKLILVFYSWVQGAGWRSSLSKAQSRRLMSPISGFAEKTLVRDQERLLKRGRHLKGADPETRHQVRIAAKKTRYATEFFQSLYTGKRVDPYVRALSRLQDELGWLNDAAVATTLLQDLETSCPEIGNNASFVRGYLTCRTRSDDIALDRLWKQFEPTALPCRMGFR